MERRTAIFLSLLLAGTILHVPALAGGFVWDDHQMIETNPEIRDLGEIPAAFGHNYFGDRADSELYRPLVNVSLALDYRLWGRDAEGEPTPLGYHLTNLLLHVAATVLLYSLLRRMTRRQWLPEVAALLFLVHPASSEPVAWIVARADIMAFALVLAVAHLHLRGRKRARWHVAAVLVYLAALFSKLSAGPAPLLILLTEWIFLGLAPRRLLRPENLLRYAAYLVPIAIYWAVRADAMGSAIPIPATVGKTWQSAEGWAGLLVGGVLVTRSGFQLLFPAGMCADYSADPAFRDRSLSTLASHPAMAVLAGAGLAAVVVALLARRRAPWFAFGVLWAAVGFLPVSQLVRIGAVMADRYLYLPAAGAAAALAAGLLGLPRARVPILAAVVVCLAAVTFSREAVWRDDRTMNADVLRSYPENADAWNRLGLSFAAEGRTGEEERAYRRGLRHSSGNRYLKKNLGAVLYETGRLEEARAVLTDALASDRHRDRQTSAIAYNLGRVLIDLGEIEEARSVLEIAVECRPPLGLAYRWLERVKRRQER